MALFSPKNWFISLLTPFLAALKNNVLAQYVKSNNVKTVNGQSVVGSGDLSLLSTDADQLLTLKSNKIYLNPLNLAPPAGYNGLVRNGSGQKLSNANFSTFTFEPTVYPFGATASFSHTGLFTTKFSDDFLPIDPSNVYKIAAKAKYSSKTTASCMTYIGYAEYDVDRNIIDYVNSFRYPNTDTTLAQDLRVGDTTVYLTSVSGWPNSAAPNYQRGFAFYNYVDSKGYEYKRNVVPYTRHFSWNTAAILGWWNDGAVNAANNTITLKSPFNYANPRRPDGVWPAGTDVSCTNSGATYSYVLTTNFGAGITGSTEWTAFSAYFGGAMALDGRYSANKFRPGAAFVKLLVLPNLPAYLGPSAASTDVVLLSTLSLNETQLTRQMAGLT